MQNLMGRVDHCVGRLDGPDNCGRGDLAEGGLGRGIWNECIPGKLGHPLFWADSFMGVNHVSRRLRLVLLGWLFNTLCRFGSRCGIRCS